MSETSPSVTTRRLAAVWFADIVDFSRLASSDEASALTQVRIFQRHCRSEVERCGGRVVKFVGDGALAEFASTEAAVQSCLLLRRQFAGEAARLGMGTQLRIGVHVGEVTAVADGDLFGDGLNIAARLQTEALPDQILVSEDVWRQLRQCGEFHFSPEGARSLKGIADPVRVFEVSHAGENRSKRGSGRLLVTPRRVRRRTAALAGLAGLLVLTGLWYGRSSLQQVGSPTEEGLTVAVLPFENVGDDPATEYFSEGIAEEIRAALYGIAQLQVTPSSSVAAYAGEPARARQIGEDLGADVLLEGWIRKQDEQVRFSAQLVESKSERGLWRRNYQVERGDAFLLPGLVAEQVLDALDVELTPADRERLSERWTEHAVAYDQYLHGMALIRSGDRSRLAEAVRVFARAISLDPNFELAHEALRNANSLQRDYAAARAPREPALLP